MLSTKYPEIDKLIVALLDKTTDTLMGELCGLYLFGSFVNGGFDIKTSDIDLLAMISTDITQLQLNQLRVMHDKFIKQYPEWNDRIEVAYVSAEAMKNFKSNTSTIARISPGEPLHFREMDLDWLMDWYMVQEQSVTLFGPSPTEFIPHITKEEFIANLRNHLPSWVEAAKEARWAGYQSYIILSLCRTLYAVKFGNQISKPDGAEWAIKEYPQWSNLIKHALIWHGSSDKSDSYERQTETEKFVEFAITQAG